MKKLIGSEKQVAGAEEIRIRYTKTAEVLKEIIDIHSDTTQKEIVEHDPIFGDEVRTVYASNTNGTTHTAAYTSARHWLPVKQEKTLDWILEKANDFAEHGERLARAELYKIIVANLEKAIAEEADATYWIDRR